MSEPNPKDRRRGPSDRLIAVLLAETVALLIALVTPITPTKTGSTWSPAELFFAQTSYLKEVLASFILVNAILGVLGLIVWIAVRRDQRD